MNETHTYIHTLCESAKIDLRGNWTSRIHAVDAAFTNTIRLNDVGPYLFLDDLIVVFL